MDELKRRLASIPRFYLVALVITVIANLTMLVLGQYNIMLSISLILVLALFAPEGVFLGIHDKSKVKNIMALLSHDNEHLRVGMEQVPNNKLKKVAIDKFSKNLGVLQFPYNHQITQEYVFPVQQVDSVREFFNQYYPNVELIT